ncbi:DnaJ domain-containing protein [Lipomyces arxii]|uniref:DnaJ domain-containing protein n=1 Tax=Lipomyces arxii TaxID=56418 RepID=UPI0034CD8CCF
MRWALILVASLALCGTALAAWTEQDHEIFRLNDELEKHEGKGTTFYSFLGLDNGPSSSLEEITKAYRKMSRQMHPDKNPSAGATDRFARLGVIANILRGEQKERYDFFLQKGFPRWKGTGYYYARFRPGLSAVLVFIFLITGAAHYLILSMTAATERKRIERYISECKAQAWPNGYPPADNSKRRIQDQSGRTFVVYPDGTVWLADSATNEEYILDPDDIEPASWRRTVLYKFPVWLFESSFGKFVSVKNETSLPVKKPRAKTKSKTKAKKGEEGQEKTAEMELNKKVLSDGKVVEAATVTGGRRRRRK